MEENMESHHLHMSVFFFSRSIVACDRFTTFCVIQPAACDVDGWPGAGFFVDDGGNEESG
jgi:hypothetical protein